MYRPLRLGLTTFAGAVLIAGVALPATAQAAPGPGSAAARVAVPGAVPSWATPARAAGRVDPAADLSVEVALPLRDEATAERVAAAVSDPSGPQYGHYLSPAQFTARYAPTAAQVHRISAWLTAEGMRVTNVAPNRHFVTASGTVAQAQRAFGTTLRTYHLRGRTVRAPASAVTVPASISPDVTAVLGLDTGASMHPDNVRPRLLTPDCQAEREVNYFGDLDDNPHPARKPFESNPVCGYSGNQMTGAYGAGHGSASGTAQTIAIVDAYTSPTTSADVKKYSTDVGVVPFGGTGAGTLTLKQQQPPTVPAPGGCQGPDEWVGEQLLDIEAAHTLAPAANVLYYGAKDCNHLYDPVNAIVAGRQASIISDSWGDFGEFVSSAEIAQAKAIFVQGAAEGISIFFSSGDNGDNAAGGPASDAQPDFPASSPWVTAVGGVSLGIGPGNVRTFQTGWESQAFVYTSANAWKIFNHATLGFPNGFVFGAGGGRSTLFAQPSWQKNVVPTSYAKGKRTVPDVAALADPYTGFLEGYTAVNFDGSSDPGSFSEFGIGGTSVASPLIAAMTADAQHIQHRTLGFLAPALYKAYNTSRVVDVRHVVSGEYLGTDSGIDPRPVEIFNDAKASTLESGPGWDNVTGVGTPNGATFLSGIGR